MKDQTKTTYDNIAGEYGQRTSELLDENEWIGEYEVNLIKKLIKNLPATPRILELGCGYGRDAAVFNQLGCSYIGTDFSPEMLKQAKENCPGCEFMEMDMRNLGFESDYFDGVWANGSVYHVTKEEFYSQVLSEVGRVLNRGGNLLFIFKVGEGEQMEKRPKSHEGGPRFYAYYSLGEMSDLVTRANFSVIEIKDYPKPILGEKIAYILAKKN